MKRIRLAWHVLRGRPLAYRVDFPDGLTVMPKLHTRVHECRAGLRRGEG